MPPPVKRPRSDDPLPQDQMTRGPKFAALKYFFSVSGPLLSRVVMKMFRTVNMDDD